MLKYIQYSVFNSAVQAISYTLGCMGLQREYLEYMGIVLAIFPLMYGFIIVQIHVYVPVKEKLVRD